GQPGVAAVESRAQASEEPLLLFLILGLFSSKHRFTPSRTAILLGRARLPRPFRQSILGCATSSFRTIHDPWPTRKASIGRPPRRIAARNPGSCGSLAARGAAGACAFPAPR